MGQLASDNFTRANENPLSDGGNWSTVTGSTALQIVSNLCESTSTPSFGATMYWNGVTWAPTQYAQVTSATLVNANSSGDDQGAIVRANGNSFYVGGVANQSSGTTGLGNPCYAFIGYFNGNTVTETELSQVVVTANVGDIWKFVVHDTTFLLYQNGTLLIIGADGTIATGNAGAHCKVASAIASSQISAWAAGVPTLNVTGFSDTFTRANGALGVNWLGGNVGSFSIVSNAAVSGSPGQYNWAISAGADYLPDQFAQVTVSSISTGLFGGVAVRVSGNGTAAQYVSSRNLSGYVLAEDTSNSLVIQKVTGMTSSGQTTVSNLASTTPGANGDVLRLEVHGSTLTGYRNGVAVLTATDSSLVGGHPGIISYSSGVGLTNFSSGSFTASNASASAISSIGALNKLQQLNF